MTLLSATKFIAPFAYPGGIYRVPESSFNLNFSTLYSLEGFSQLSTFTTAIKNSPFKTLINLASIAAYSADVIDYNNS